MKNILDELDYNRLEEQLGDKWKDFREQLANKEFKYDDIDEALKTIFLSVFNKVFENGKQFLEKRIDQVIHPETSVVRAARINPGDPEPDYERFIPKAEFIREDNRFSPPGKEWLYLAFSQKSLSKGILNNAEKCALKECRANVGENFALCKFHIKSKAKNKKLIDLTITKEKSYQQINAEFIERYLFNNKEIEKWVVFIYSKLLADTLFVPVATEDKSLMYAPFQCLAHYFFIKGYVGIVYPSTVFREGKNVVLFDKMLAEPIGEINKYYYDTEI